MKIKSIIYELTGVDCTKQRISLFDLLFFAIILVIIPIIVGEIALLQFGVVGGLICLVLGKEINCYNLIISGIEGLVIIGIILIVCWVLVKIPVIECKTKSNNK